MAFRIFSLLEGYAQKPRNKEIKRKEMRLTGTVIDGKHFEFWLLRRENASGPEVTVFSPRRRGTEFQATIDMEHFRLSDVTPKSWQDSFEFFFDRIIGFLMKKNAAEAGRTNLAVFKTYWNRMFAKAD